MDLVSGLVIGLGFLLMFSLGRLNHINLLKSVQQLCANRTWRIMKKGDDVATLREAVKEERRRAERAWEEVERERRAAAEAAEEAMGMMTWLQSEKCRVEMEGRQYRRMAEERAEFVEGVAEGLRRSVAAQEEEIRRLEDELVRASKALQNHSSKAIC